MTNKGDDDVFIEIHWDKDDIEYEYDAYG